MTRGAPVFHAEATVLPTKGSPVTRASCAGLAMTNVNSGPRNTAMAAGEFCTMDSSIRWRVSSSRAKRASTAAAAAFERQARFRDSKSVLATSPVPASAPRPPQSRGSPILKTPERLRREVQGLEKADPGGQHPGSQSSQRSAHHDEWNIRDEGHQGRRMQGNPRHLGSGREQHCDGIAKNGRQCLAVPTTEARDHCCLLYTSDAADE